MSGSSFTKEEILKYWAGFFPETDAAGLEKLVKSAGIIDPDTLKESYDSYDSEGGFDVNTAADFDYCDLCKKALENNDKQTSFYSAFVLPVVNRCIKYFSDNFRYSDIADREMVMYSVFESMFEQTVSFLVKPVVYEYNYMRDNDQLASENGENARSRFVDHFSNADNVRSFYSEYQTAVNLIAHKLREKCEYILEILEHSLLHRSEISKIFSVDLDEDRIITVLTGSGDTHQHGRSVAQIFMQSGKKLIYKPHQMKTDIAFNELLCWMKDSGAPVCEQKSSPVLCCSDYGFTAFTENSECTDEDQVKRFYERSGQLLCVLHSLNGTDMHYENIIADGEYPVLIDLETVIHPKIRSDYTFSDQAEEKAFRSMTTSVLYTGMLPEYSGGDADLSGLGASVPQKALCKCDILSDDDSDDLHFDREYSTLEPCRNNPVLNGQRISAGQYTDQICKGFSETYRWIENNSSVYLSKISGLFSDVTGRIVLRDTNLYCQLLYIALSQEFSRKEFERKLILHRIFLGSDMEEPDICRCEYEDLLNGDVPYFVYKFGDDRIYHDGLPLEKNKLESLEQSISIKIKGFCESDLKRQTELIRESFKNRKDTSQSTGFRLSGNIHDTEGWLRTAEDIADLIIDNAFEGKDRSGRNSASWLHVSAEGFEKKTWIPTVISSDLYDGKSGIAFFLAQLWKITGKKRYLDYSLATFRSAENSVRNEMKAGILRKGLFDGVSGLAYVSAHISKITGDISYAESARDLMKRSAEISADMKNYNDIISGNAGIIAALLSMKDIFSESSDLVRSSVSDLSELIAASAVEEDGYVSWPMTGKTEKEKWVGFAHGNSGIHTYLYLADRFLGTSSYSSLIGRSLTYERKSYDPAEMGWYRSDKDPIASYLWCHGSGGVLLSKLLMYREGFRDELIRKEISDAVMSIRKFGFGDSPCYCHGDIGSFAVLDFAGRVMNDVSLRNTVYNGFGEFYRSFILPNWNSRKEKICYSYGLMTGLSGLGYSLISHYTDFEIPQVLWLE